ncbi:GH25 family lysozyme [Catellatospora coxensis]
MNRHRTAAARRAVLAAAGLFLTLTALPAGAAPPGDPLGPDGRPITDGWAGAGMPAELAAPPAAARVLAAAPGGYPVTGIDVSHHQGTINWDKVADKGAKFVYAKVTEGVHYVDASFKDNHSGARKNGILFGAYHFARPDKTNGRTQADFFLDRAQYRNDGRSLPPMLDIEWPYKLGGKLVAPGPCWGKSKSELVRFIRDFTQRVRERTGSATMIYTNPNWWNPCTGKNADFGDHYLFISSYTDKVRGLPAGWDRWTLWQYANHGKLPGDQNVFNGTMADLNALAANPAGPLPRPVVGDWDGNGTMTPGLVSAEGDTWRWRLSNTLDGTPIPRWTSRTATRRRPRSSATGTATAHTRRARSTPRASDGTSTWPTASAAGPPTSTPASATSRTSRWSATGTATARSPRARWTAAASCTSGSSPTRSPSR